MIESSMFEEMLCLKGRSGVDSSGSEYDSMVGYFVRCNAALFTYTKCLATTSISRRVLRHEIILKME
jgi:hypothetical protein